MLLWDWISHHTQDINSQSIFSRLLQFETLYKTKNVTKSHKTVDVYSVTLFWWCLAAKLRLWAAAWITQFFTSLFNISSIFRQIRRWVLCLTLKREDGKLTPIQNSSFLLTISKKLPHFVKKCIFFVFTKWSSLLGRCWDCMDCLSLRWRKLQMSKCVRERVCSSVCMVCKRERER